MKRTLLIVFVVVFGYYAMGFFGPNFAIDGKEVEESKIMIRSYKSSLYSIFMENTEETNKKLIEYDYGFNANPRRTDNINFTKEMKETFKKEKTREKVINYAIKKKTNITFENVKIRYNVDRSLENHFYEFEYVCKLQFINNFGKIVGTKKQLGTIVVLKEKGKLYIAKDTNILLK